MNDLYLKNVKTTKYLIGQGDDDLVTINVLIKAGKIAKISGSAKSSIVKVIWGIFNTRIRLHSIAINCK